MGDDATLEPAVSGRRRFGAALGPGWVATGQAEPLVAAILGACLLALLVFDLQPPAANPNGNPTAVVVLLAVAAGWMLRARWALPVWVLVTGVCAAGVATGAVLPLNAVAISAAAVAAGIGSHAGATAYRESLAALDRQVDLIRRASALVSGPVDPPAVLEEVLHATAAILAASGGDVGAAVLAVESGRARVVSAVGPDPLPAAGLGDPAGAAATGVVATVLRSARQAVTSASGRAGLARLDVAGAPWGVLVAGRPAGARFTGRELVLLRAVADLAGAAIDARRRTADLERMRERFRAMLDLAVEIGSSLDPGDVATGILRRVCDTLDSDRATLVRVRGEEAELVAVHDRGGVATAAWIGDRFPTDLLRAQPAVREAMEGVSPVACAALQAEAAAERYRDAIGDVRAMLVMPLRGSGELVGLLTASRTREPAFTGEDRATIGQFASVAVLALLNSWAHLELERGRRSVAETARQLQVAVEAAEDVGFETEPEKVTRRLLVRAVEAAGAERGSIGRIDGDVLIVEADWTGAGEPRHAGRMLSLAGVPGLLETLRSGQSVRHTTAAADGPADTAERHGLQYPLLVGGELVGVMSLSRGQGGPFGDAELHGLQQLTSLTALTLRSTRLLAQARDLGRAKNEFLNMAAHELRTPLAVVRGYLSMMADGTLEVPETTRHSVVSVLCAKTDELSAMVEQILTAAQIQADGVQVQRHVFDLRDAIASAVEAARPRAEQAGVELWCQPLPDPIRVDAVQRSVVRILDNLIGNAIAYGDQLPIRLTVEVAGHVLVRVEDQGLGISPEQQARLFEPFFRVDQPAVQGQAGAGLGLAVSRRLAELSGGSLDLEWTQVGAGSTFVLRLQAAMDPAEQADRRQPVE